MVQAACGQHKAVQTHSGQATRRRLHPLKFRRKSRTCEKEKQMEKEKKEKRERKQRSLFAVVVSACYRNNSQSY
jgi:hypothetical protein